LEDSRDIHGALAAYQRAIESADADAAAEAVASLGMLLEEQGELAGAQAAYRRAIGSGRPHWAS
jgi:tetratricopeptide (TPR) repeat protein